MVRQTRPGDVLFFSFSGYGLQAEFVGSLISSSHQREVDDMDGYQDEGFEEAILPTDFVDGRDGDYSVICTNDLHDVGVSVGDQKSAMGVQKAKRGSLRCAAECDRDCCYGQVKEHCSLKRAKTKWTESKVKTMYSYYNL